MNREEFAARLDRAYPGIPEALRSDLIDFAGEVSRCHINSLRNGGTFWAQQMAIASQDFLTKVARGNDTKRKVIETEEEARSASQENPVAYAVFAENGNIRIWCDDPIQAETLRQQYGEALQPLYTAPQPAEQQEASLPFGSVTEREVFERWAEQFDHDCDQWEDMGRDDVFIAGMRAAPDVAGLVEALVACAKASSAAEVGLIVDAALAAHRKGGE